MAMDVPERRFFRFTHRRVNWLFVGALLILLAAAVISYVAQLRFADAAQFRSDRQQAVQQLGDTLTALLNVETGGRGYALVGLDAFLEPYQLGTQALPKDFSALDAHIGRSDGQTERLRQLKEIVAARLALTQELISRRRAEGLASAGALAEIQGGKSRMDEARRLITEMIAEEQSQLNAFEQQAANRLRQSTFTSVAFLGFAIVLLSLTFRLYRDEQLRRTEVEGVLLASNENLKLQTERALSADRLKSAFLATMSHELRTPLNSIIGFSAIIEQGLAGPVTDEQKKQLGMVLTSARHLLALINEILDLSKIEAGQLELEMKPFVLNESIRHVVELLKPQAEKKQLRLSFESEVEVQVVSDRRRIEQVLMNLAGNAIKFTEEGSVKITLRTTGATSACIEIVDTGIGIQRADLERLFKPFQQLSSGLARPKDGTGLGLSICKKLLHLLGGNIAVRSEWGAGSTFVVNLPVDGVVSAAKGLAPHPSPHEDTRSGHRR